MFGDNLYIKSGVRWIKCDALSKKSELPVAEEFGGFFWSWDLSLAHEGFRECLNKQDESSYVAVKRFFKAFDRCYNNLD